MRLQTQFTVPIKDLRDLDYVRKMQTLLWLISDLKYSYPWFLYLIRTKSQLVKKEEKKMTNLSLEILFWTILIGYLGLRLNQTWNSYKQQY